MNNTDTTYRPMEVRILPRKCQHCGSTTYRRTLNQHIRAMHPSKAVR